MSTKFICPDCGSGNMGVSGRILVAVALNPKGRLIGFNSAKMGLTKDDVEWDESSAMWCEDCSWDGRVKDCTG